MIKKVLYYSQAYFLVKENYNRSEFKGSGFKVMFKQVPWFWVHSSGLIRIYDPQSFRKFGHMSLSL